MIKKVFKILLILILITVIGIGALIAYDPSNDDYTLSPELYTQLSNQADYTYIDDISPIFLNVLVANEDKRFYDHMGFDLIRIVGAIYGNIKAGELETGGSSITQQLAKNLFYSQEQTFSRKLLELGTALRLELYFSKEQILEMYVNVIYYGSDAYGIKQASQIYFDILPGELDIDDAGVLVGLLPAPSVYNPNANLEINNSRKEKVLDVYEELKARFAQWYWQRNNPIIGY